MAPLDVSTAAALEAECAGYRERLEIFLPSRLAARDLTGDALRASAGAESVIAAAADVAAFTDDAMKIVREDYRPPLKCQKACSYCCRKPGVLIAVPELVRILDYVQQHFDEGMAAALRDRAARYAAQVDGRDLHQPRSESVPCPLLVDDLCSVYEVRPLVCRSYNSTSAEACRRAHDNPAVLVPIFAPLKDVTDGATVGMAQRLRESGLSEAMVDLGTALHLALSADSDRESILAGGLGLERAERPGWVDELWSLVTDTADRLGVHV